jgi:hypothetical protein
MTQADLALYDVQYRCIAMDPPWPEKAYAVIERVSPGPRVEMFARTQRPGWSVWGNEV